MFRAEIDPPLVMSALDVCSEACVMPGCGNHGFNKNIEEHFLDVNVLHYRKGSKENEITPQKELQGQCVCVCGYNQVFHSIKQCWIAKAK